MRAVAVAVALLLLGGCGVRPSGVIRGVPAPDVEVRGTVLYLVRDGRPVLTVRRSPAAPSPAAALTMLAAGPTPDERGRGLTSEVPAGTAPVTVAGTPDLVTVTTATDVAALSAVALEQIVCTVSLDRPVVVAGGGGRRDPLTCPDDSAIETTSRRQPQQPPVP